MEFSVQFYQTEGDDDRPPQQPMVMFLDDLRRHHPDLEKLVVAGLKKLRNRAYHRPPLAERVDARDGIYELRVGGANIARILLLRPGSNACRDERVRQEATEAGCWRVGASAALQAGLGSETPMSGHTAGTDDLDAYIADDSPEELDELAAAELAIDVAMLLHAARERRGLSQAELGKRIGLSQQAVSKLERPRHNAAVETLRAYLGALGYTLEITVKEPDTGEVVERVCLPPDRQRNQAPTLIGANPS